MIKVSICITTYNHEKYIAEAIESVLMQKTNFEYEIIIGEDESKDRTREIVQAYKNKYPDKIILFLNNRSNVIFIEGRPTGRWNFINNLKHAKGQYIALLEGDDYWTDNHKLQKQIDFLDNHPGSTLCFHDVLVKNEGTSKQETVFPGIAPLTFDRLLENNFIPTCSVVYRRIFDFNELPAWYRYSVPMGDWPLHVLHAHEGKIGKIDKVMAVYREHDASYWAIPRANLEYRTQLANKALSCLYEHFRHDNELADHIKSIIIRNKIIIIMNLLLSRKYGEIINYFKNNCLKFSPRDYKYLSFSAIATINKNKIMLVNTLSGLFPKIHTMIN